MVMSHELLASMDADFNKFCSTCHHNINSKCEHPNNKSTSFLQPYKEKWIGRCVYYDCKGTWKMPNDTKIKPLYSDLNSKHIYFYRINKDGAVIYERTFPRNCMNDVMYRIKELQARNIESLYTIGFTLPGAFY